ncbi:MAG: ATP-binding cassette domain-containing protein, partial [Alistipes sp.]
NVVDLQNKTYKMPYELSGGEQQRMVIARALLNRPKLLLADEPTGNLDPVTADGIMLLFQEIARRGCAVVMSTHNTALIEQYPSRTILFSKGRMREINVTEKLANHTIQYKCAESIGCTFVFSKKILIFVRYLNPSNEYRIRKRKEAGSRILCLEHPSIGGS